MKTTSIIALITIAGTSATMLQAAEEVRTFDNGFAQRTFGNVYAVFNFTGVGARDQDKDIDGGDGPLKGDIIGLTATEKAAKKDKITYIAPQ